MKTHGNNYSDASATQPETDISEQEFTNACKAGNVHAIHVILSDGALQERADLLRDLVMVRVGFSVTALHMASVKGKVDMAKVILESLRGKDTIVHELVMMSGDDDMNVLHLACVNGHLDVVKVLFEHLNGHVMIVEGLILAREEYDQTALHLACVHGHTAVVQLLLETILNNSIVLEDLVLVRDTYNRTALHLAFEQGYSDVIKVIFRCLKEQGEILQKLVLMKGKFNMTVLHMACMDGQDELIKILFKHMRDPVLKELVLVKDCINMSAMEVASKHTNFDCICYMLHHRSNVSKIILSDHNVTNVTPTVTNVMIQACQRGANEAVHSILTAVYHADTLREMSVMNEFLKAKDTDGKMVLQIACSRENRKMVRAILKNIEKVPKMDQNDILCHTDSMGRTALHESCQRGDNQIVQMLLDAAHKAECVEKMLCSDDETRETTALFEAFENGQYINVKNIIDQASSSRCVRKLLLECKDNKKHTLFHRASQYKYNSIRCLEVVIKAANECCGQPSSILRDLLLAQDSFGKTFLCYIAGSRDDVMRLLIKTATEWEIQRMKSKSQPDELVTQSEMVEQSASIASLQDTSNTPLCPQDEAMDETLDIAKLHKPLGTATPDTVMGSQLLQDPRKKRTKAYIAQSLSESDISESACYILLTDKDHTGKNALYYAQQARKMYILTEFLEPFYDKRLQLSNLMPGDFHLLHKPMLDYGVDRKMSLLTLMGESKCLDMIQHKYTQDYLNLSWKICGGYFFITNIFLYLLLLLSLTTFVVSHQYDIMNYTSSTQLVFTQSRHLHFVIYPLIIFAILSFFYELLQIMTKGRFYWRAKHNYTDMLVCLGCLGLCVASLVTDYTIWHHRIGTCTMCVACINFAWMMTKIPSFSRSTLPRRIILMFTMMFRVIGRVCIFLPVFAVFIVTFALAFHSLLQGHEAFSNIGYSILKTVGMTIGELDLDTIFFSDGQPDSSPFFVLSCLLFVVFLGIVTISAMNLLVGMAVGDINELSSDSEVLAFNTLVDLTLESQALVLVLSKLKSYCKTLQRTVDTTKSDSTRNKVGPDLCISDT